MWILKDNISFALENTIRAYMREFYLNVPENEVIILLSLKVINFPSFNEAHLLMIRIVFANRKFTS